MNPDDWSKLMDSFRIVSPALGGWAVYLLRQVLGELRTLNMRLTKVESWQGNHDEKDDMRFENLQAQVNQHRDRMGLRPMAHKGN
jgi:hypothetical protein